MLVYLRGVKDQLREDGLSGFSGVETVNEEMRYEGEQSDCSKFIGDVSGKPLNAKLVEAAGLNKVRGINQHKVWEVVPISECL